MFDLSKKIICVTGSNGLIGREIANTLREAGSTVIGIDIRHSEQGDHDVLCDTTSENDVNNWIDRIYERYGRIDGWVNNAYPRTADWGAPIETMTMESWRTNVDLLMNSFFMCSRAVLERMKNAGRGCVINMGSIYGVQAPDFTVYNNTKMTSAVGYSAIKGGIINLTRYLAAYYGKFNLRVNTVSPGGIFDNQPQPFVESYENKVPLKRMGKTSDIAPGIVFLMSDEASYVTGHNLLIDGGWTIV